MPLEKSELGKVIGQIRKQLRLSRNDVAKRSGLTLGFLSLMERGERGLTIDSLNKLAEALDVPVGIITFLATEGDYDAPHAKALASVVKEIIRGNLAAQSSGA
jgi:transcriptional regulator with XRE-family HTH domain